MAFSDDPVDDTPAQFYVGHHETKRDPSIVSEVLFQAQQHNYDMLTTRITNSHYHSRVLTLVSTHQSGLDTLDDLLAQDESFPLIIPPLNHLDTALNPSDTVSQLLLLTSPWIDLSSQDPLVADVSRQVLIQEISYASFCGAVNVIVPAPRHAHGKISGQGLTQYARSVLSALGAAPYTNIHMFLSMTERTQSEAEDDVGSLSLFARRPSSSVEDHSASQSRKSDLFGAWDIWNVARSVCKYSTRLFVALTIPSHLPPMALQSRWFSEPIRILNIPSSSFLRNAKGYPVLSKSQQQLVYRYMRLRPAPWVLLSDVGPVPGLQNDALLDKSFPALDPTPAAASQRLKPRNGRQEDVTPHLSYIRYLQDHQPPKPPLERFGAYYQDYLQNPLQPLADNLESITYEVFEKDPIKYEWYERAISNALTDWHSSGTSGSGPEGQIVVAVVGAGRGPLVTRALNSSRSSGVSIDLWALEKNPNAFVLLQRHNVEDWNQSVHLVQSDMRGWLGPQRDFSTASAATGGSTVYVDILISELLGSFGDNELSPECLDGIQQVLNPTHGISIPSSYTAHLTPIASPKIYSNILSRTPADPEAPVTPYVVMLHAIDYLSTSLPPKLHALNSAPPKGRESRPNPVPIVLQAWEFKHPNPKAATARPDNAHNARFAALRFFCRDRGVCHGLAGYFETVLYRPKGAVENSTMKHIVELSINPLTIDEKSRDMISWFPMYFPLKSPMYFPDDTELEVSIWRQTDGRKVWYEWVVEVFAISSHQPPVGGERIRLGVSELHSSEKNGCLM